MNQEQHPGLVQGLVGSRKVVLALGGLVTVCVLAYLGREHMLEFSPLLAVVGGIVATLVNAIAKEDAARNAAPTVVQGNYVQNSVPPPAMKAPLVPRIEPEDTIPPSTGGTL